MKISINSRIIEGPWGGGNQAVIAIRNRMIALGHQVIDHLEDGDIDAILMIHPNYHYKSISYGIGSITYYRRIHPNTVLIHRVNTSGDIHRGYGIESKDLIKANRGADYTVFISNYLRTLYGEMGYDLSRPHSVILNGADRNIFHPVGSVEWQGKTPMRIITHHWSSNMMKGFDIYKRLDDLLGSAPYKNIFEFTIVGNIPKQLKFFNSKIIPPLSGHVLASEIRNNHIYLTASRNEAAGMHHIEGMQCGLPVLYLNSGAVPEYCSPYGVEFNLENFEEKLMEIRSKYHSYRRQVLLCPYSSIKMADEYAMLIKGVVSQRRSSPFPEPLVVKKFLLSLLWGIYKKALLYSENSQKIFMAAVKKVRKRCEE